MKEESANSSLPSYNVICIKWGTKAYGADDINILAASIRRNTKYPINFHCFTDCMDGLTPDIIAHDIPAMKVAPEHNRFAYRKEAGLCYDELGGLRGQRVYFFDLDSLIVGNLDEFFEYPQGDEFYIIEDWNHRGAHKHACVGQASCYSWVVGTLGYVLEYFEQHPVEVVDTYWTGSQEYLSAKVIERKGKLNFWPDHWFKSYRFHCLPLGIFRRFIVPKMPRTPGLKMIAFHGNPGIRDAIKGVWCDNPESRRYVRGWKHLYKHNLPAPWVEDFWHL